MILLEHAKRYPMMQTTDAVKLIYQNEFGGGHLIRDQQACRKYLRQEYKSVEKDASMPLHQVTESGVFTFGTDELRTYLMKYAGSGYPMVSHSQEYRILYKPAYIYL